ncbi:hypothetical protein DYD21_13785 [Rhodohalobacter sp. SW132]|uniref:hypothetical protein n=1 Tax=Rhodohalobacter sp. SW132 TaxID=2293433 RepID=UPI000E24B765|nr:hypothetical protein [Rhodohalobacter sp. SW132]REL32888.1 hypothetical protein DYD21_13785 [Rhodohalobacter sp. SW132]
MKTLYTILASLLMVCAFQTASLAQTSNISETFKKHFNETVQVVHGTEDTAEKRAVLNESFNKIITVIDRIESRVSLTDDEIASLESYKLGITEKVNELNGLDGFDEIADEDLDDFSSFSQEYIEQANRTITIGVGTALLIVLLLLIL